MIKPGTYSLRSGNQAVVLTTAAPGDMPLVGYYVVFTPSGFPVSIACNWRPDGKISRFSAEDERDIIALVAEAA